MLITVCSTKGGAGKTTTVCNVAATFGEAGYDVLTVDLDPQASLTKWYGVAEGPTIASVFERTHRLTDVVYTDETFGFDLIPSARSLREVNDLSRLRRPLHRLVSQHYDLCIIDTPPSVSRFMSAAVEMSQGVVVPVEASMAALDTLADTLSVVAQLGGDVMGIVVCRVDARTSNDVSVQPHLAEQYPDLVFDQVIRESVAVRDSHAERVPTVVHNPRNNAAQDYKALAFSLKARIDHHAKAQKV